ncbi:MAG: aminotransferase class I/II-fold pyridoxal phosphate-dependent enzyme [Coriobacteriia bacterium]|nr:aminotransferase class I/II-fold pyridoxal phosphate-dependent enzyme [Coriobacteriia bacterium]
MSIYDYSRTTIAARVGTEVDNAYRSLGIPIYMTNNFLFEDVEQGANACRSPEFGDCYTRISNPTNNELGKALAALEGGEAGVPFASGAAAFSALAFTLLQAGCHVLSDDTTYSATNYMLRTMLTKFGVETTLIDFTNYEAVQAALRPNTKMIFFETPCNPTMKVIDIARIAEIARSAGVLSVIDNTFSTPFITAPLELGIDVVLHSSTKFLGGHGDAMGGALVGPKALIDKVMEVSLKNLGGCASPFNSFLILRGLKTLQLRMQHSCKMSMAVAEYLDKHPKIECVHYPGLPAHPGHAVAKKQMEDFGALLTFEVKGGIEAGTALMNSVKLCALAVSLGEANTLVQHPASMTHWYVPEDARRASGISDGLIRFAAGLESIDEIIEDLSQALLLI